MANNINAFIPQQWSRALVRLLREQMRFPTKFRTDFKNEIQDFGNLVNTRQLQGFTASLRPSDDSIAPVQDAVAIPIAIPLDQWVLASIRIQDTEQALSFDDLFMRYGVAMVDAIARRIDGLCGSMVYQFLDNTTGGLETISPTNFVQYVTDTYTSMNQRKVMISDRNLIMTPATYGAGINNFNLMSAYSVGDTGQALATGELGLKYGFMNAWSLSCPSVSRGTGVFTALVNNAGGYNAGATSIVCDTGTGSTVPLAGQWYAINGVPYQVTAVAGVAATPTLTLAAPGLVRAVPDNATVVGFSAPMTVNNAPGYPTGYVGDIIYTGTIAPQVGQMVTFSTGGPRYAVASVNTATTRFSLYTPLEQTLTNGQAIAFGPPGQYNFAFHPEAVGLIMRSLGTVGAMAAGSVMSAYTDPETGIPIRWTMHYDADRLGTRMNLDLLAGIKKLDTALGCVMLG